MNKTDRGSDSSLAASLRIYIRILGLTRSGLQAFVVLILVRASKTSVSEILMLSSFGRECSVGGKD